MAAKYKGVMLTGEVKITHAGKRLSLGCFKDATLGAKAWDRAAYKLRGDASGVNCGPLTAAEMAEIDGWTEAQLKEQPGRNVKAKTSVYRGVYWDKHRGKWQAQATGKALGRFDDEEDARRAVEAAREVSGGAAGPAAGAAPRRARKASRSAATGAAAPSPDGGSSDEGTDDEGSDDDAHSTTSSEVSDSTDSEQEHEQEMTWEDRVHEKYVELLTSRYAADPESVVDGFETRLLHAIGVMPAEELAVRIAAETAITAPFGATGYDDLRIGDRDWVPFPSICIETAIPEWRTEPFILHQGAWTKIRSLDTFEDVLAEVEAHIKLERDYADGTFTIRHRPWNEDHAAWEAVVGALERKAEHVDNIIYAVKRKMAMMREYGFEVTQLEALAAEARRLAALEAELAILPPAPGERVTMRIGELDESRAAWFLAFKTKRFPLPPPPRPPLPPPLKVIPVDLCDVDEHGRLWPPAAPFTDEQVAAHMRLARASAPRVVSLQTSIDDALATAYPEEFGAAAPVETGPADEEALRWKRAKERWWADEQAKVANLICRPWKTAAVDFWRQQRANPPPFDRAACEAGIRAAGATLEAEAAQAEAVRLATAEAQLESDREFMRNAMSDGTPELWRAIMMEVSGIKII